MYLTSLDTNYSENSVVPKAYVDVIGSGLKPAAACVCATTASLPGNGGSTGDVVPYGIPSTSYTDGYQVQVNNYVLVACQGAIGGDNNNPATFTSAINNGVWIVKLGDWSRPLNGTYADGTNAVGAFSYIQNGDNYDNNALVQINNPGIVGIDELKFTELYQVKFKIGQGLYLKNILFDTYLNVDTSLNFINYLDSDPTADNATGTLSLGTYSSKTIIGPTGPSSYPIVMQSGVTGPAASFTNGYFTNMNVSGPSILNGLVSAPAGITGATGSFTNMNVFGRSILNGLVLAPAGITGATGSFTNVLINQTNGFIQFPDGTKQTTAASSSQWVTTGTSIYYNSGNVGIGNSNPRYPLDVSGNIYASSQIYFPVNVDGPGLTWGSNNSRIYDNDHLHIYTDNEMYIDSADSVKITSSNTTFTGSITFSNTGVNVFKIVAVFGTPVSVLVLQNGAGNVNLVLFDNVGNIFATGYVSAIAFIPSSDYRIKESVVNLDDSYNVDKLRPVFYYNTLSKKNDMGFIAHEVQEVFPFLVIGEKDGEDMQGLNYTGLIPVLVKEVQDLKKENKMLKERLERIEQLLLQK